VDGDVVKPKANRRSSDVSRFPHAPSNSTGVPRQAGARKNLLVVVSSPVTWTLEDEKRSQEEVTGDVVTSGLSLWMKEGKIEFVLRRMVI
jgi:hypothetical protein